jgi:hypothetical protein
VVPEVDTGAPVVDLTAGAGAVWAVTSGAGLLRIDPGTARLTAPNPGPVSAIAAGASGVWARSVLRGVPQQIPPDRQLIDDALNCRLCLPCRPR